MLLAFIGVIILLSLVVFFHELGHYLVAKAFRIKVEVFSLGFGKKILQRQIGETNYCISLLPFGGYVKLFGDDPTLTIHESDKPQAFNSQPVYKRFLVVFAGPFSNILLAFGIYSLLYFVGMPTASNRVGHVVMNSPAWNAGFRNGDKIKKIDGHPIQAWEEIADILKGKAGQTVQIEADRNGPVVLTPQVEKIEKTSILGENALIDGISGLQSAPLSSMIGVSRTDSVAKRVGLQTGDRIIQVDGSPIETWDQLAVIQIKSNEAIQVQYERIASDKESKTQTLKTVIPPPGKKTHLIQLLGIAPSELFIRYVDPDSAAAKSGLQVGDQLISINRKPVYSFEEVQDKVRTAGKEKKALDVRVLRNGKFIPLSVIPTEKTIEHPLTHSITRRYLMGISSWFALASPDETTLVIRNPYRLLIRATREILYLSKEMVVGIWKLVIGEISVKAVGGPIQIASIAGQGLKAGIIPFLEITALISINLFLINLFPIPLLDGGHLFFYVIEFLKGSPVSPRTMEVAQRVGLAMLLSLLGLSLYNDIARLLGA